MWESNESDLCFANLVKGGNGLATHVLEQQHGGLQMLPTTGIVQCRVAILSAEERQKKQIIGLKNTIS